MGRPRFNGVSSYHRFKAFSNALGYEGYSACLYMELHFKIFGRSECAASTNQPRKRSNIPGINMPQGRPIQPREEADYLSPLVLQSLGPCRDSIRVVSYGPQVSSRIRSERLTRRRMLEVQVPANRQPMQELSKCQVSC
jgi:hypothetical protein